MISPSDCQRGVYQEFGNIIILRFSSILPVDLFLAPLNLNLFDDSEVNISSKQSIMSSAF